MKAFLKKSFPSYCGTIPCFQTTPIDFSIEGVLNIEGATGNNRRSEQLKLEDVSNHRPWIRVVELLAERTHGRLCWILCALYIACRLHLRLETTTSKKSLWHIQTFNYLKHSGHYIYQLHLMLKTFTFCLKLFMFRTIPRINSNYFPTYH